MKRKLAKTKTIVDFYLETFFLSLRFSRDSFTLVDGDGIKSDVCSVNLSQFNTLRYHQSRVALTKIADISMLTKKLL